MKNSERFLQELTNQYRELAIFEPQRVSFEFESVENRAQIVFRALIQTGHGFTKEAVKNTCAALSIPATFNGVCNFISEKADADK